MYDLVQNKAFVLIVSAHVSIPVAKTVCHDNATLSNKDVTKRKVMREQRDLSVHLLPSFPSVNHEINKDIRELFHRGAIGYLG